MSDLDPLTYTERFRETWQFKTVSRTKGNQTPLGAVLLAALGKVPSNPPHFSLKSAVLPDGWVVANFTDQKGIYHAVHPVFPIDEMVDRFRILADECKLDDADRIALFHEIRAWVAFDYRLNPSYDFGNGMTGYDKN